MGAARSTCDGHCTVKAVALARLHRPTPATTRPPTAPAHERGLDDRVLELQRSAGNTATTQLLRDRGLVAAQDRGLVAQRLMSKTAWQASTSVKVGKRGGNNPELLRIDSLLAHYQGLDDRNDPELEQRFQALTDIETTVYAWYNRRFDKAKPSQSARLTAMYDLLDDVATEHDQLVSRTVAEGKDLPLPKVGGAAAPAKGDAAYQQIQTMWKAIVNETGSISFTSKDAKKTEDYPDFKQKMLPQFARLLRTSTGRDLIHGLLTIKPTGLSQQEEAAGLGKITIRPTSTAERQAGRVAAAGVKKFEAYTPGDTRAGGGKGIGSYLSASPVSSETGVTRAGGGHDVRGNALLSPLFIVLAHEIIHILHNLMGVNCKGTALADWENLEEKLTISGRDANDNLVNAVSEQGMRRDYGLQQERFGH